MTILLVLLLAWLGVLVFTVALLRAAATADAQAERHVRGARPAPRATRRRSPRTGAGVLGAFHRRADHA